MATDTFAASLSMIRKNTLQGVIEKKDLLRCINTNNTPCSLIVYPEDVNVRSIDDPKARFKCIQYGFPNGEDVLRRGG